MLAPIFAAGSRPPADWTKPSRGSSRGISAQALLGRAFAGDAQEVGDVALTAQPGYRSHRFDLARPPWGEVAHIQVVHDAVAQNGVAVIMDNGRDDPRSACLVRPPYPSLPVRLTSDWGSIR
jgi:hypothetical protein